MLHLNRVILLSGVLFGIGLLGCAGKSVNLLSSARVPAASGVVKIEKAEGKNMQLEIKVKHLASAQTIAPGASGYVVWVQPTDGAQAQNVGALNVDEDLNGTLTTITPYHTLSVFITPEPMSTASYPTGEKILSSKVIE